MILYVVLGLHSLVKIVSLGLLGLLVACSSEQLIPQAPKDLIGEELFVELIVELNLIEAVKSVKLTNISKEEKAERTAQFYENVWVKHGINEEQFKTSFAYYRSQTETMAKIYGEVALKIKRLEDLNNQSKQEEAAQRDQEKKSE